MAGRSFIHYNVRFMRQVDQAQTVNVAVDAALAPELAEQIATQLAPSRLKDSRWEDVNVGKIELVNVQSVEQEAE